MGGLRFVIVSATYIFIYPFLLKSLGPAQFGLWALLCVPGQLIAIGDFGLSTALIKLIAELSPVRDRERALHLASAGTIVFAVIGAIMMTVVFVWQFEILHWLRIAPALLPDARVLLLGMAGVISISLLGNVYTAILSGVQRMDLAHALQIGSSLLNAAGIVALIKWHTGLTGLMLCNAASAVAVWFVAIMLVRRMLVVPWILVPKTRLESFRSLIGFSVYVSVTAVASVLMEPSVKVMLARYGSIEYVSFFELASRIVAQCRSLFQFILLPLLPAASLIMYERGRVALLYSRSMRFLTLTAIPVCLCVAVFARPIIHLWLGKDVVLVENALALLAIGWLFNILTVPDFLLMQGMNLPGPAMWCALIQGVVCVTGGYFLMQRYGFYGVIYAEIAGFFLAAAYIHIQFMKICPSSVQAITGNPLRRILTLLAVFILSIEIVAHASGSLSIWVWLPLAFFSVVSYGLLLFRKEICNFTTIDLLRNLLTRAIARNVSGNSQFPMEPIAATRIADQRSSTLPSE
jgi:O-antigen/teichoic acid export membrane protein